MKKKNVLILDKEETTARQQSEDLLPFISHSTFTYKVYHVQGGIGIITGHSGDLRHA